MDGELTGVEMIQIRRHLADCRECTEQYESLRHTKHLLSRLTYMEPRAGLVETICTQLRSIEVPAYQKFWHRVWALGHVHLAPVATGCLALGVILVFLVSGPIKKQDIVPLDHSVIAVASTMNMQSSAVSPASVFTKPSSLIPELPNDNMSRSGMFYLASFDR